METSGFFRVGIANVKINDLCPVESLIFYTFLSSPGIVEFA